MSNQIEKVKAAEEARIESVKVLERTTTYAAWVKAAAVLVKATETARVKAAEAKAERKDHGNETAGNNGAHR